MNFKLVINPLPFPMLNDLSSVKLLLGLCLFLVGALVFSMWKERVFSLQDEDRAHFLMFNIAGGSWLIAVFAVCGGLYFLFDSVFQFAG